jgi:hypothetical protein
MAVCFIYVHGVEGRSSRRSMSYGSEKRNRARDKVRNCLMAMRPGDELFAGDIAMKTGLAPFSVGKILIDCDDIVDRIPNPSHTRPGGRYRYRRKDGIDT